MDGTASTFLALMETYGVAGALLLVLLGILYVGMRLGLAYIAQMKDSGTKKPENGKRGPGTGTMFSLTKDQIDNAREHSKEKLQRLEKDLDENKAST